MPAAGSVTSLAEAVNQLSGDQRVRVLTTDSRTLSGYFMRFESDSLYLSGTAPNRDDPGSGRGADAVRLSEISLLWKIDDYSLRRGLLWAGGALLAGGLLTYAAGSQIDSPETFMLFAGVTVAAAAIALYLGGTGSKETLIYSRYRHD
jgi:hypothetical protein